jgi:hypothetical protein
MAISIPNLYTQLYPQPPNVTEANPPSLSGKAYIVTGGNAGVGFEPVKMLYSKGANVYMASRSRNRTEDAMKVIQCDNEIAEKLSFSSWTWGVWIE